MLANLFIRLSLENSAKKSGKNFALPKKVVRICSEVALKGISHLFFTHNFQQKMKKTFFFSLSFIVTFGVLSQVSAYSETTTSVSGTFQHKLSIQEKLTKAIQLRWNLFRKKHVERNTAEKTIPYQKAVHQLSMKENNVPNNPNIMNRSGELQNYDTRRQTTDPTYTPSNSTSVLRSRLIDYYIDGGDAGTALLRNRGIKSSEYTIAVPTAPRWATADPETVSTLRSMQRSLYTAPKVGAGQQSMSSPRKGDYYRNFRSPFRLTGMSDEEETDGGFFSTEAE